MTLDDERFKAIEWTRDWLRGILIEYPMKKRTVKQWRREIYSLAKHYPETYFMRELEELYWKSKEKNVQRP